MVEQIRLRTLLKEDELYRKWFMKEPTLTVLQSPGAKPWSLFIQREQGGRWAKVDLPGYVKAYAEVRSRLQECWDMTIRCKPQGFPPPRVKIRGKVSYLPMPAGHTWCIYCRRPTVFGYYSRHPNITWGCNPEERRCGLCGARAAGMKNYEANPNLVWPLAAR